MELDPIGVVHSPVTDTHKMPHLGVPAVVEVYEKHAAGLLGVESNTHIMVVSWMHLANRRTLQLDKVGPENVPLQKGVFAVHSPARPNPLAITTSRLVKVEGRRLFLERFDMVDGTQVVDIKGYTRGGECVFSARTFWDYIPPSEQTPERNFDLIMAQAESFHGRRSEGIAAGAKLVAHATRYWDVPPRDDRLSFVVGCDVDAFGCMIDAVLSSTGATFGNGRLVLGPGSLVQAHWSDKSLAYTPCWQAGVGAEAIIERDAGELFQIEEIVGVTNRLGGRGACGV